jgi:hypothetical protein
MYGGAAAERGKVKDCDNIAYVKKAIDSVEKITSLINHKDMINLLLIRAKPK